MLEASITGRRGAARARIALPARLQSFAGTAAVTIRNVSEKGLLLEAKVAPPVRVDVMVTFGGLQMFGLIVWTRGLWCGLAFDEDLSHADVLRLRAESDAIALQEQEQSRRDLRALVGRRQRL